jgi:hypothetical protein
LATVVAEPAGAGERSDRLADTGRLLRSPLAATLLGEPLTMDLFAQNGFRSLAVPAWLDRAELSTRVQRFRNTWRLDPALARRHAIRTITDTHLAPDAPLQAVSRLDNPRHRFISELFWVHVPEPEFSAILAAGDLRAPAILRDFSAGVGDELATILRTHVVALSLHCQALEAELDLIEHRGGSPNGHWEHALRSWRDVWRSDTFWSYLQRRVAALDDPRLIDQDVARARAELPGVLLSLHAVLAERYAALENYPECVRHLDHIRASAFPADDIRTAMLGAVKKVVGARLEDLLRRARQTSDDMAAGVSRRVFEAAVAPLLADARSIQQLLIEQLELPEEYLELSAFDEFAQQVQKAVDKKVSYADEERERNLLYSSTMSRRLLSLPLSGAVRRTFAQSILSDSRMLYTQFGMEDAYPDATKCFFVEGAPADPEASLIVRMYRITDRDIQVDRLRGSAGIRVSYRQVRLLVPRSVLAAEHAGGGTVRFETAEVDYTPAQREAAQRLKRLGVEHRRAEQLRRDSTEENVRAEEEQTRAAVETATEKAGPALTEARRALASEAQREVAQRTAERQRLEGQQRAIRTRYEPRLQAARAHAEERNRRLSGGKALVSIDVPLASVAVVALALSVWRTTPAWLILAIGIVFGLLTGRLARRLARATIERDVSRLAKERDAELQVAAGRAAERERELHDATETRCRPWKETVRALDREVARLEELGRQRVSAIRRTTDEQARKAKEAFEASATALRAELSRTVKAKRETAKTDFPAYQGAKGKGFKEGSEPSGSEMQMTESERMQALRRLRF